MKRKNLVILVLLLVFILSLNNCASTKQGFDSTIENAYPDRIEKTVIGMDFDDFKTIWAEATKDGIGEIYTFTHIQWTIPGVHYAYKVHTKFYFSNNKLVKYESNRTYN